ncbi:DNA/RNA non-specific endonuclease [Enterococcus sp. B1E4]|uniref:DNA/RNA non-specific endonuclease n=1 Tax=Enterococcus sp. B1E4 TaxID=3061044 RepID=UPI00265BEC46|nr:DNA/RNA non-specific endonuclease [Enterococcus sp. B1E4]MDO0896213.1 DNA/RNA non-specific endonuclease [Enterococcus sp. B1E4]
MKHKSKFILAALISLLGFTASLIDLSEVDIQLPSFLDKWTYQEEISAEEVENISDFDGHNVVVRIDNNVPSFTAEDMSVDAGTWQTFSDLDSLNRVGVADAMLHQSMMPTEERGDISNVYPTGWNQKKLENNVWLYNRSHLIGFQMTGENDNWKNLFTGTQQLNQIYMVQFENEVANYLRNTDNHIRYRVTPVFRERELLARAVQLEAQSVEDDQVQINVLIYNVQDGVTIDYHTGQAKIQ